MKLAPIISGLVGSVSVAAGIFASVSPANAVVWRLQNFNFTANLQVVDTSLLPSNPTINTSIANAGSTTGTFDYDFLVSPNTVNSVNITAALLGIPQPPSAPGASPSTVLYNTGTVTTNGSGATKIVFNSSTLPSSLVSSVFTVNFSPALNNSLVPPSITASLTQISNDLNSNPAVFYNYTFNGTANSGATLTAVPFEIPGGAAIPTIGTLLALGLMRKFRKGKTSNTFITQPTSQVIN